MNLVHIAFVPVKIGAEVWKPYFNNCQCCWLTVALTQTEAHILSLSMGQVEAAVRSQSLLILQSSSPYITVPLCAPFVQAWSHNLSNFFSGNRPQNLTHQFTNKPMVITLHCTKQRKVMVEQLWKCVCPLMAFPAGRIKDDKRQASIPCLYQS